MYRSKNQTLILAVIFIFTCVLFIVCQINFFTQLSKNDAYNDDARVDADAHGAHSENKNIRRNNFDTQNDDDILSKHKLTDVQYFIKNPRVCFIITVEDTQNTTSIIDNLQASIESITQTTPKDRILLLTLVFMDRVKKLRTIFERFKDAPVPINYIISPPQVVSSDDELPPGNVSNGMKGALEASQNVVKILKESSKMSDFEDVPLVIMKSGTELVTDGWLDIVTRSLMGYVTSDGKSVINPANAISFSVEGMNDKQTYSINMQTMAKELSTLDARIENQEKEEQLEEEDQQLAYPTPILEGTATAMKLKTYEFLPVKNPTLNSLESFDIETSFNLWMCGDGIDTLPILKVKAPKEAPKVATDSISERKQRLASRRILFSNWLTPNQTRLVKRRFMTIGIYTSASLSKSTERIPKNKYCRDFEWFLKHVNQIPNHDFIVDSSSQKEQKDVMNNTENHQEGEIHGPLPSKPLSIEKLKQTSRIVPIDIVFDASPRPKSKPVSKQEQKRRDLLKAMNQRRRSRKKFEVTRGIPSVTSYGNNNTKDYVHDVTSLRRNPPPFVFDNLIKNQCNIQDETWLLLTEKVKVNLKDHEAAEHRSLTEGGKPRAKIMCIVYTVKENHDSIPVIRETWGSKCDGFMAASNQADQDLDIVKISHRGKDTYGEIWYKVQGIWSYVYDKYYNDFDWFHIGGDGKFLLQCHKLQMSTQDTILLTAFDEYLLICKTNIYDHGRPLSLSRESSSISRK